MKIRRDLYIRLKSDAEYEELLKWLRKKDEYINEGMIFNSEWNVSYFNKFGYWSLCRLYDGKTISFDEFKALHEEKIAMSKDELLEYAKKNYPIGTKYVPAHVGEGVNEVISDYYEVSLDRYYVHVDSANIKGSWNGAIYDKSRGWAKIISKPQEKESKWIPKVGDWVIANGQDHTRGNKNFPLNKAWKIKSFSGNDNYYVHVDKSSTDITGVNTNKNSIRLALPHEIPYGVKITNSKEVFPKEQIEERMAELETKSNTEIDSWCVQLTKENREKVKEIFIREQLNDKYALDGIGHYYGIDNTGRKNCSSNIEKFDKLLTTEQFYDKFSEKEDAPKEKEEYLIPKEQQLHIQPTVSELNIPQIKTFKRNKN